MRILNCFLDNRFGGPQRRAYSIACKLRTKKIETFFLFNEKVKDGTPVPKFKCCVLQHLQCLSLTSFWRTLFLFFLCFPFSLYKVRMIIRKQNIDIVHVNGSINIIPVLAAKLEKMKLVWHLNGTVDPWIIRKICARLATRFADTVAIAAEKVGCFYFGNNEKFWKKAKVLYAPVDMNEFNPHLFDKSDKQKLREELNIDEQESIITAVGNINISKGYKYFIEAAREIKKHRDKIKFLIVGNRIQTQQDYWKNLKKKVFSSGLQNDVLFVGFRNDVPAILSITDVFVLSSVTEACPMAVLEAVAMGLPVVATDVGGVREQLPDNNMYMIVAPRDYHSMAKAILNLLDSTDSDCLRNKYVAKEKIKKFFSLEKVANDHKKIYESLSTGEKNQIKERYESSTF